MKLHYEHWSSNPTPATNPLSSIGVTEVDEKKPANNGCTSDNTSSHALPVLMTSPRKITLLHGLGGTGKLWRPLAIALEPEFDCIAVDQRGHGKSQVRATPSPLDQGSISYTPQTFGQDLIETLETVSHFPSILVGHSMGVRTAIAAAHLKPDFFSALVLIDLGFDGPAGGGLGSTLASFLAVLPLEFEKRSDLKNHLERHCPDPAIAQYLIAVSTPIGSLPNNLKTVEKFDGPYGFPFDRDALIQTIRASTAMPTREYLRQWGKCDKPAYILRGEKSSVWTHEEFLTEQTFFSEFAHFHFIEWSQCGHGLPFEKKKELAMLIKSIR